MAKKEVTIRKDLKVPRGKESKMRKRPGSSSAGNYKTLSKKDFAGPKGGASKGTFPINTLARARNALARAHYAPDPAGIKKAVYAKYPDLKKRSAMRKEGKKPAKLKK